MSGNVYFGEDEQRTAERWLWLTLLALTQQKVTANKRIYTHFYEKHTTIKESTL